MSLIYLRVQNHMPVLAPLQKQLEEEYKKSIPSAKK